MEQKLLKYFLYTLCFAMIFSTGFVAANIHYCTAPRWIANFSIGSGDAVVCPPFRITFVNVQNSSGTFLTVLNINQSMPQSVRDVTLQVGQSSILTSPNYTLKFSVIKAVNFTQTNPSIGQLSSVFSSLAINYSYIGPGAENGSSSTSSAPTSLYATSTASTTIPVNLTNNSTATSAPSGDPLLLWVIAVIVVIVVIFKAYSMTKPQ
jgi:hypothetical protein